MMNAHKKKLSNECQTLRQHSFNVGELCGEYAESLRLSNLLRLIGYIHDMGKATKYFQNYLYNGGAKEPHSPVGAIYAYCHWFYNERDEIRSYTAQIIALCIHGHHAGLCNCIDISGHSEIWNSVQNPKNIRIYEEAAARFLEEILDEHTLESLFVRACAEVKAISDKLSMFERGMLVRVALSILVDADRWDTACFEDGEALENTEKLPPDWTALLDVFDRFRRENLTGDDPVNRIRGRISEQCFQRADGVNGIYTLSVPTGCGKTFSSLRYALKSAIPNKKRIFYIIPYNTILDQNASDIRRALDDYDEILEHHSNVITEDDEQYHILTERWDSHIILTSLVQFLNACFRGSNTDVRRLYRLADSVLIFDEIQSLPKRCTCLFQMAIEFLVKHMNCTVLLCTATQPNFEFKEQPIELVGNCGEIRQQLRRVHYHFDLKQELSYEECAAKLSTLVEQSGSVLAVVNTTAAARKVFQKAKELLEENGINTADSEKGILCVMLSTKLCPAHRKKLIAQIKQRRGRGVFCVSTQLIEAGINLSFQTVVRSAAGLPSIIQAAGRCNRSMEYEELGDVYVWNMADEKLEYLSEIQHGQEVTGEIVINEDCDVDDERTLALYFEKEKRYYGKEKRYPIEKGDYKGQCLCDMLSENRACAKKTSRFGKIRRTVLPQSFAAAGKEFRVIDNDTRAVLVPYDKGEEIIIALNGRQSLQDMRRLLREAQQFSVNLYEFEIEALERAGALYPVGDCGAIALRKEFYNDDYGVSRESESFDSIIF